MRLCRRILYALFCLMLLCTVPARAEVILGSFSGLWDTISGEPTGVLPGEAFTGTFAFDTRAVDGNADPQIGLYPASAPVTLSTGSLSFAAYYISLRAEPTKSGSLVVTNDDPGAGGADAFQFSFGDGDWRDITGAPAGTRSIFFSIDLFDSSGTAWGDDAPPRVLNLADFDPFSGRVTIGAVGKVGWTLSGALSSLTLPAGGPPLVPEPSSAAIWSLVALGAWTANRRRRCRH